MPDVQKLVKRIDEFQQRHRLLAFGFGVVKKFGDDQGGNLAALITYYGFLSLFPLLLVLVTVLGFVLQGHPGLQHDILNSAVADFPIIGDQIKKNVGSIHGNGLALAIGIVGTFYGGLGIANAAQDAMNRVWAVPFKSRPGFFPRIVRSLELIATLGLGILFTTVLSGIGGGSGDLPLVVRVGVIVIGFLLNILLFGLAFKVLTARDLAWRDVLPGALVAAIAWGVLQVLGGAFVSHVLKGTSQTYGLFALVLGLLAWIFLQARIVVYAAEVNVVKAQRLWPRSLAPPPLTNADKRAYAGYAKSEERRPDEEVDVELPAPSARSERASVDDRDPTDRDRNTVR
jgi:YihY family inner membrane protein